jgi:hypothetical protein
MLDAARMGGRWINQTLLGRITARGRVDFRGQQGPQSLGAPAILATDPRRLDADGVPLDSIPSRSRPPGPFPNALCSAVASPRAEAPAPSLSNSPLLPVKSAASNPAPGSAEAPLRGSARFLPAGVGRRHWPHARLDPSREVSQGCFLPLGRCPARCRSSSRFRSALGGQLLSPASTLQPL